MIRKEKINLIEIIYLIYKKELEALNHQYFVIDNGDPITAAIKALKKIIYSTQINTFIILAESLKGVP